ncbi:MAG: chalcone isomerase family protein [Granulosicoccus sp.]
MNLNLKMSVGHTLPTTLTAVMVFATIMATSLPSHAKKVAGVDIEDTLSVGSTELVLNGAGLRKKLFIKLYVGGLYLGTANNDAAAIIEADAPMMITLDMLSDLVTQKKMLKALNDGFSNATDGKTEAIQAEIALMQEAMQGKISKGDNFTYAYEPGVGTHVLHNDEETAVIEGLEFKKALFGIWLSDKPAQKSLKKAMLGG